MKKKLSRIDLQKMKTEGKKAVWVTAYDFSTAQFAENAGMDMILVGDSLGMCIYGYDGTVPVTMDQCIHHCEAVRRAARNTFIVGDMPFLSYQTDIAEAVRNAGRFLKEAGAHAVKLEGGAERAETVKAIVETGIPVMGHLGLTPQSVHQIGGYRVQGRSEEAAQKLMEDALALQEAGIFSLVLECVPSEVAEKLTAQLQIPTLGIGAGPHCDGQVLVIHDLLGFFGTKVPKFVKRYALLQEEIMQALHSFQKDYDFQKNKILFL
jgi:3-methyl-2-oxobutanoate hydroxymethyltransferase